MSAISYPITRKRALVAWALFDEPDARLVASKRLTLSQNGYVRVRHNGRNEYLHRVLLGLTPGDKREVDHKNGNPLDCRRSNMRVVSRIENMQNVKGLPRTSRHRGVHRSDKDTGWVAQVTVNGTTYHLGTFLDEDEAASTASEFRRRNMPGAIEGEAA